MSVTALLYLIVIVLVVFKLCNYVRQNLVHLEPRIIKYMNFIPGPGMFFIFTKIPLLFATLERGWIELRKLTEEYPKIFKLWGGNRVAVFLSDPDDIEIILSSNKIIQKPEGYDFLHSWLGTGLLLSDGDKWRIRRKMLTPAFHFSILKEFSVVFEEQSERVIKIINDEYLNREVNVVSLAVEHALYSLCETTMGVNVEKRKAEIIEYKKAIHKFGFIFMDRMKKPWLYPPRLFNLSSVGRQTKEIVKVLHAFTSNVLKERLLNWDNKKSVETETASGKRILPMMDILITEMKKGAVIDYEGICEEVDTFMFEGHDTVSMNLSFLLMLLANNPDVQNKILEEQLRIFGDTKRRATYEDLQEMEYLERCIKEALRLYPSVPHIGRLLAEDLVLKKYLIPAGVYVYLLIYDLHRDPTYWPNPEKFDPDRFLYENSVNRHPFAYIPFSAGPRNCIGKRFAILELKSIASKIIREFILEAVDTPETVQLKLDLVIRPSRDIKVKFRKRV